MVDSGSLQLTAHSMLCSSMQAVLKASGDLWERGGEEVLGAPEEELTNRVSIKVVLYCSYPRASLLIAGRSNVECSRGLFWCVDDHCLTGKGISYSLRDQKSLGKRNMSRQMPTL